MADNRIRMVRQNRGLTVRELADRAGLSNGLISQVERGLTDPSLETLRRIGRALNASVFSLLGGDDVNEAVSIVPCKERIMLRSPRHQIEYTRVSGPLSRLEVLEGVLEPGAVSSDEPLMHPSEECVIALDGELIVEVFGEQYRLGPRDSCSFDSRSPHRYLNPVDRPVSFLLSVTPPSY